MRETAWMWRSGRVRSALALSAAAILLFAGIAMSLWFERSYEQQKAEQVSAQARVLAATVTAALSFDDPKAAQEYVNALAANPEIEAAGVYDARGALFAGYSILGRPLPNVAEVSGPEVEDGRLFLAVPVVQDGRTLGTVYIETVADPLIRRAAHYAVIALFVVLAALVVLVLAAAQSALARANAELESRAADLAAANNSLLAQIAQREKAEAALRQAQKMEVIGQLTGGVAHDFNNLLQIVIGSLELLRQHEVHAREDVGRLLDSALRGAERGAVLTQRLLAFSRQQPLTPRPVDVNRLVGGMSDLLRRTLGETIAIETVLTGGLWRVSADANQLESALLNLAVNARDAMPDGGRLTIKTANVVLDVEHVAGQEEVRPGPYVIIATTDTGTGMTKEVLQKAFDPFFTTKEVGKGSGLGLSQVYGFMRQSGGHARIDSEPGHGTTVTLYLPRLVESAPEEHAAGAEAPTAGRHELVLIVEDDDDVRANTAAMLRALGYDVVAAPDGPGALRLLDEEPRVRLLFTDIGLPGGMNGRQLADEARRLRPDLEVLFTTGYARSAIVHHGRLDPGVELIEKPFTLTALAAKLRSRLEPQDGTVG